MKEFRNLDADEIECRPQQIAKDGTWASLLLYTNARMCMNLLDEKYGIMGWQRTYCSICDQLFCTIEIWDNEHSRWIKKQDIGTESNIDAEKGRVSDAFKRACVSVGIGRELYSAPQIFITLNEDEITSNRNSVKLKAKVHYSVKSIEYNDKNEIKSLIIIDKNGTERYSYTNGKSQHLQVKKITQKDDEYEIALEEAIVSVKSSNNVEELKRLWDELPGLTKDPRFVKAVSERKGQLKK